ncbi:MAG: glycoside hydrolase family 2 protein [Filimonas sp.]|nr:glycoside hydrolase family 2 protein [Filimonas sp.]
MFGLQKKVLQLLLVCCSILSVAKAEKKEKGVKINTPRQTTVLQSDWLFSKKDSVSWTAVTIPHSWNTTDVMDDTPGYYRGIGWYKRKLAISDTKNKKTFLYFDGANQETTLFVNGKTVGVHAGGYTRFSFDITSFIHKGQNDVVVKVDNSFNQNIAPLSADFTFFGGIYRNVYLISTSDVHADMNDHAASGIYITTPAVSAAAASTQVRAGFVNESPTDRFVKLETVIYNPAGKKVAERQSGETIKTGAKIVFDQLLPEIKQPLLWSTDQPNLYKVVCRLYDGKNNTLLDEVTHNIGYRWYSFSADSGFYLNGKSLKLIGASRHQDYKDLGNALPGWMHERDVQLIKSMGGNFLRVAHYPQDPVVLETCDKLGILTSVEIPVVNRITLNDTFAVNCAAMQVEMIRQNFNHPSVVIWAYMNEIFLKPPFDDSTINKRKYDSCVAVLARNLEALTRKEDPTRYTMMSNHGDLKRYDTTGLTAIPMIIGWNLYSGWYGGKMEDFGKFLDNHHSKFPTKPVLVTEYGADADERIHSFATQRFDKSVEYAVQFHKVYLDAIQKRPFVAGGFVWNLADFNSETRGESTPHINSKGLLNWERKPKDSYVYYEANLVKQPVIRIASRSWQLRAGKADSLHPQTATQPVEVYSNLDSVQLLLNGKTLGVQPVANHVATWQVPFVDGVNILTATAVNKTAAPDVLTIHFNLVPRSVAQTFKPLNIWLGMANYFIDTTINAVWVPDQPYQKGGWGYIAKQDTVAYKLNHTYHNSNNVAGTDNDPLYQTNAKGIAAYKIDVPDGKYTVTMLVADNGNKPEPKVESSGAKDDSKLGLFVNDVMIAESTLSLRSLLPPGVLSKTITVVTKNGEGITINSDEPEGLSSLSALQVKRAER